MDLIERVLRSLEPPGSRLLACWSHFFDHFNHSSQAFYEAVEKNLDTRQVPNLKMERLKLSEGGIFSANRIYLQMRRERLMFLICAAPFGTGYFVSSRLIDQRRDANPLHYVIAILVLAGIIGGVSREYGWTAGMIVGGFIFSLIWFCMRLAVSTTIEWLEELLIETPVVGPIYESLFRPNTFYRQDQAQMYQQCVHRAVMQAVNDMVNTHGLRPLGAEEQKPQVPDWYRR